ncbi:hypothetical protein NDU88_003397 [Pleurodeles waltl]|uniref:Uncharacterized protein n=1 Tax=Pleurodeles waltl TaxID=8319 RepID=A0AAV7WUQ7_PLEWA|nr:hypothetical protein NDU88_003397 [Pleurodeles waltl]
MSCHLHKSVVVYSACFPPIRYGEASVKRERSGPPTRSERRPISSHFRCRVVPPLPSMVSVPFTVGVPPASFDGGLNLTALLSAVGRCSAGPLLYCSPAIARSPQCSVLRERGSRRVAPGVRAIPLRCSRVFGLSAPGSELSRARVRRLPPSWFLDVVGARPCSPPQPLFFSRRSLLRIYRAGVRSPGPILPIIFGVWKCCYFGRAPFTAPDRRAKRAASSAAGHAPQGRRSCPKK